MKRYSGIALTALALLAATVTRAETVVAKPVAKPVAKAPAAASKAKK